MLTYSLEVLTHGWLRPDPVAATRDVILPIGGGLLGMILFPGALFRVFQYFFPAVGFDNKFVCESPRIQSGVAGAQLPI